MRLKSLTLALVLPLAACVLPAAEPLPTEARLSDKTLTVRLTDGSTCTAPWRETGGQGRFTDCAAPLSYQVTEVANPNILRKLWIELVQALQAEGIAPPMADVTVTSDQGRNWRFVSPPPAG